MEISHGGVRTKAMEDTSSNSSKRRKIDSRELVELSSLNVQLVNQCPRALNWPRNSISPAMSGISNNVPSSPSNEPSKFLQDGGLRSLDLKAEGFETEISMNGGFSRVNTPTSEFCADSEEMESSTTTTKKKPSPSSSRRKPSASKMPSTAEIDEFFTAAEKYEQKRFAEKYNYDIVKDMPLKGRYQWVRLKP